MEQLARKIVTICSFANVDVLANVEKLRYPGRTVSPEGNLFEPKSSVIVFRTRNVNMEVTAEEIDQCNDPQPEVFFAVKLLELHNRVVTNEAVQRYENGSIGS